MKALTAGILFFATVQLSAMAEIQLVGPSDVKENRPGITKIESMSVGGLGLRIAGNGDVLYISKEMAQASGYSLGELHRLIFDYQRNPSVLVKINYYSAKDAVDIVISDRN